MQSLSHLVNKLSAHLVTILFVFSLFQLLRLVCHSVGDLQMVTLAKINGPHRPDCIGWLTDSMNVFNVFAPNWASLIDCWERCEMFDLTICIDCVLICVNHLSFLTYLSIMFLFISNVSICHLVNNTEDVRQFVPLLNGRTIGTTNVCICILSHWTSQK